MVPRFLYPFLAYRSFIVPILVVSAVAVPCWVAFRLYRLRTRRHPVSLQREALLLILVLYLSGVAATTLTPNRTDATVGIELRPSLASLTCSSAILPEGSSPEAFCTRNAAGNVALFFPLGILIPLVWTHLRFWRGLQIAVALSLSIEVVQYLSMAWGSYRSPDVNDVILNAFGACLGLALVSLLRWRPGTRPEVLRA